MNNIPNKILKTYSSLYIPRKSEHFESEGDATYSLFINLISWIILGFAVYLSFRCNKRFDLVNFLVAFFFAPFYIIYHLATTKLCGLMQ
jgi:hypothetical protein